MILLWAWTQQLLLRQVNSHSSTITTKLVTQQLKRYVTRLLKVCRHRFEKDVNARIT